MTPIDEQALRSLAIRLRHAEAVANLIARHCDLGRDECDSIAGIALSIGDVSDRLNEMTEPDSC